MLSFSRLVKARMSSSFWTLPLHAIIVPHFLKRFAASLLN